MNTLRWLLLGACLVSVAVVASKGYWEARLTDGNSSWIISLNRGPIWRVPEMPAFADFQRAFGDTERFPAEEDPGTTVVRALNWEWTAADLLLYLWLVSAVAGSLYRLARGACRDFVLHLAMCVGIGMSIAAICCIALWVLVGGWGLPAPEVFGGTGLLVGLSVGVISCIRSPAST